MARIWEEDDSLLSMTSTPGRLTPSSSTAAALGPACACGENSKPGHKLRHKSECRSHDGSVLSPTVIHRDGSSVNCRLDLLMGARVGLEGEHISVEAEHQAAY